MEHTFDTIIKENIDILVRHGRVQEGGDLEPGDEVLVLTTTSLQNNYPRYGAVKAVLKKRPLNAHKAVEVEFSLEGHDTYFSTRRARYYKLKHYRRYLPFYGRCGDEISVEALAESNPALEARDFATGETWKSNGNGLAGKMLIRDGEETWTPFSESNKPEGELLVSKLP